MIVAQCTATKGLCKGYHSGQSTCRHADTRDLFSQIINNYLDLLNDHLKEVGDTEC